MRKQPNYRRSLRSLNLCALRAERARLVASRDWFPDPNTTTPPTPADLAAVTADRFGLDVTFKIVAVDNAIASAMRGFVRMRHDEIDDLVEDLQSVETWLGLLVRAVAGRGKATPIPLAESIKFVRQTRKRLLSANHHGLADMLDPSERQRQRDEQADREATRTIRPGVAP